MGTCEKVALYPGSFDPPTNGHSWVIEKIADQFDKAYVSIGYNPDKAGRFPIQDRLLMLQEITKDYPHLFVNAFTGLLQADFAEMVGAQYIVRGTRNPLDFMYENDIRQINTTINSKLETTVYIPPKELLQVSSSMVMGLVGFEGWQEEVSKMVPVSVMKRLERFQQEKDTRSLEQNFTKACEQAHASGPIKEVFAEIINQYAEPHRKYHNLSHIITCLNEFTMVADQFDHPELATLALFYHDLFQNQSKEFHDLKVNDVDDSIERADHDLFHRLHIPKEYVSVIRTYIEATKHDYQSPLPKEEAYIADIDLAILGRSSRLFNLYEKQIRQEYNWVPSQQFAQRRSEILKKILDSQIYQTDFFTQRYKTSAVSNLTNSLQQLQEMM